LKKCLYSLGEERELKEVEHIIQEFGDGSSGCIDMAHFQNFIMRIYGDTGTKEEVIKSFELLSKGEDELQVSNMDNILILYVHHQC
jgi:Ca2+-binding EF-hand superfamily protein